MKIAGAQNLLSACCGERRITIGMNSADEIRRLSDARSLVCPGCSGLVTLHAGSIRTHHFSHLPGAVCSMPQTEPETEEHRAGKLLVASWLLSRLPSADIIVEAHIPETEQRADVLVVLQEAEGKRNRVALEFQCANLSAREWRRRHNLYRRAGIDDLWILGSSRLHRESALNIGKSTRPNPSREKSPPLPSDVTEIRNTGSVVLRTTELERAMLWDSAPLLFLNSMSDEINHLTRFRPDIETQALRPSGRLSARPLIALEFPWKLLDWPSLSPGEIPTQMKQQAEISGPTALANSHWFLWQWLAQRFQVTDSNLSSFFGLMVDDEAVFRCESRLWQAACYYRFIHLRVGDGWWLSEVETWARAYLPIENRASPRRLRSVLESLQELFSAAGFLSLPMGYSRSNSRIIADLTTLHSIPDQAEVLRLARYRRTARRE